MKSILHIISIIMLLPFFGMHAMLPDALFTNEEDVAAEDNPLFPFFQAPSPSSAIIPVTSPQQSEDTINLSDSDNDSEDEPQCKSRQKRHTPKWPRHTQAIIDSTTQDIKALSLLKFKYDMDSLKVLDRRSYQITLAWLMYWHANDKNRFSDLKKGTPAIIEAIEEHTPYRFPENIKVPASDSIHCSLSDVACFTQRNVYTTRAYMTDLAIHKIKDAKIKRTIKYEIPSTEIFIRGAMEAYLKAPTSSPLAPLLYDDEEVVLSDREED